MTAQFQLAGYTKTANSRFLAVSRRLVNNLNGRMKAQKIPGRLSLEDGRKILAMAVGKPCPYCEERMIMSKMTLDHPVPLARGGNPWEVVACDRSCNNRKSDMLPEAFLKLLGFLKTLDEPDRNSVLYRLAAGAAFPRMQRVLLSARQDRKRVETLKGVLNG